MTKALYLALLVLLASGVYSQADEGIDDDEEDVIGEVLAGDEEPKVGGIERAYVSDEDQEEEFFDGIKDDTMMQQVISDMNGLEQAIARERLTRGGNVSELAEQTLGGMKRFADLKKLVSWMQPQDKRISRYCFYGCWCLPEGAHGFTAGTGRPVDNVDKACMYLWFCYTCAKQDFGTCNPNLRRYAYKFVWNPACPDCYDQRGITCTNGWRRTFNKKTVKYNCARAICECDKGLAIRLYKYWTHWDKSRHRIWSKSTDEGLFIVEDRCIGGCNKVDESSCQGNDHELICCGQYTDDGSRFPTRDHNGKYECCAENYGEGTGFAWHGNMYNKFTQCCNDDGTVGQVGEDCEGFDPNEEQATTTCNGAVVNVVFLVDGSGSVGSTNFEASKHFTQELISVMDLGAAKTTVTWVQYASGTNGGARVEADLSEQDDQQTAHDAISAISYIAGGTQTGAALAFLDQTLLPSLTRQSAPFAIMVLTDGQSGDISASTTAAIEAQGGTIFSIGVGNANQGELDTIASDPDSYHVYNSNDWNLLESIKFEIAGKLCKVDPNIN